MPSLDRKMTLANLRKKARLFFGLQYLAKSPIFVTPPAMS
jgi:hypothetical protein